MKDRVIDFSDELDPIESDVQTASEKADQLQESIGSTSHELAEIRELLESIPGCPPISSVPHIEYTINEFNNDLDRIADLKFHNDMKLSAIDIIVSITAGVLASIVDIIFVGTPEVVKIYKGGENFDGSILTGALRKIGNNDDKLSGFLKWCSEKCKVPYDISAVKGTVNPNNHRLRNPAHDPLFGLLFAVADIILGTCTLIDNEGKLKIIVNPKDYPDYEKYLAVIYYLGHLLSDVCTARGLPVPGMFLTQFFANGDDRDSSIAGIVEQMYKDGYDLRHLISMSTPVAIKNLIIELYIRFFKKADNVEIMQTIAKKELKEQKKIAFKYRMILISDAVCCGGNALKFFIPPTTGSPTALNLPEWCSLIKNTVYELKYQLRDKTVEKVICNRETINQNWLILLN